MECHLDRSRVLCGGVEKLAFRAEDRHCWRTARSFDFAAKRGSARDGNAVTVFEGKISEMAGITSPRHVPSIFQGSFRSVVPPRCARAL
jgi:hypothetical protein